MTGRGGPCTPCVLLHIRTFPGQFFPIQTWRGQDLNDGQGQAPATPAIAAYLLIEIFPIQTLQSQDLNDGQGAMR